MPELDRAAAERGVDIAGHAARRLDVDVLRRRTWSCAWRPSIATPWGRWTPPLGEGVHLEGAHHRARVLGRDRREGARGLRLASPRPTGSAGSGPRRPPDEDIVDPLGAPRRCTGRSRGSWTPGSTRLVEASVRARRRDGAPVPEVREVRIAIGGDHAGFGLKEELTVFLPTRATRSPITGPIPRGRSTTRPSAPPWLGRWRPASRSRDRPGRFRAGGADRRQQDHRDPCGAVPRPVRREALAGAQRRERPQHGRPRDRARVRERDRSAVAGHAVRGRSPRAEDRADRRHRTRGTMRCRSDGTSRIGTPCRPPTRRSPPRWPASSARAATLRLIASENYACPAVLAALGSTLTNKYAEGYPGRRYYGGCRVRRRVEEIGDRPGEGAVRRRARQPAAARGRQRQPGRLRRVPAPPGDTVLAMVLAHGGHLTHGSPVNFSGKWFNTIAYGVPRDRADRLRPRSATWRWSTGRR